MTTQQHDNFERIACSAWHESVEPFAYADDGALVVRLRLAISAARAVHVVHYDKFLPDATLQTDHAERFAQDGPLHELFQARLTRTSKRFRYYFRIATAQAVYFYSRAGVHSAPPQQADAFEVPYLGERDRFAPPLWTKGAVYYQVFPDRFARGAQREDYTSLAGTDGDVALAKWDDAPTGANFFGGTLRGITENLDHLSQLGVDVLYMTPIFAAPSNHKYDTTDYFKIDPAFGSLEDLRTLTAACRERGIRVVLDAVFNHMGADHPIFRDILEHGQESAYSEWIYPASWPLSADDRNYETFGYVANMPKWRTAHPEVVDYLTSVGLYWINEAGIDGWRLDVSDEVEHRFWQHFRAAVKARKPDALICGEIWQLATPWLRGDQFDAVMNYPLGEAILSWIARRDTDADGFHLAVERIRAAYPEPVLPVLWTLLDSHDTPRLLTVCAGDRERAMLAGFLQFTCPGAPVLYYGDEVGMAGGPDPLCRAGMVWDSERQNAEMLEHYRRLTALRARFPSLRTGDMRPVFQGHSRHLYGFVRRAPEGGQLALCLVNNGPRPLRLRLRDSLLPRGAYRVVHGPGEGERYQSGQALTVPRRSGLLLIMETSTQQAGDDR